MSSEVCSRRAEKEKVRCVGGSSPNDLREKPLVPPSGEGGIDQTPGDADIQNMELARDLLDSCFQQARFGGDEGAGMARADHGAGSVSRVAVETTGQVDGQDWGRLTIHLFNRFVER